MDEDTREESSVKFETLSDFTRIREIYSSINAHELYEHELEKSLVKGCQTIIIEPQRLGEETARWISMGHCLHKTCLISGLSSLFLWRPWAYCPLAVISVLFCGLYKISCSDDPCSGYRVESDEEKLVRMFEMLPDHPKATSTPVTELVVLTKKGPGSVRRCNLLNTTVSLFAIAFGAFKMYKYTKFAAV